MSKRIEVVVRDMEGYELAREERESVKDAKQRAAYCLGDQWARTCESTHDDMRTCKAEVLVDGVCVWDKFRK